MQARTIPRPIVELLKWTQQMSRSITIFYNRSEYLWFIDRFILRGPFGKNGAIIFFFLMFQQPSYPAISCLVKWNSVLRSILSLISSALHFPNVFLHLLFGYLIFSFSFFFLFFCYSISKYNVHYPLSLFSLNNISKFTWLN